MAAPADAEKLDKLKEKYAQLKQNNAILKKGLLEKQESCTRLEQQLTEKETTLRQQLEEIDKLQFQNSRLSKQVGVLTTQVDEQKQQLQQSRGGWSVPGLISGKQQQEQIQKAEDEIRVLQDDLMRKIQENEDLHMQLFEMQRAHDEESQKLRDSSAKTCSELEKSRLELEAEQFQTGKLRGEAEDSAKKIAMTEAELSQSTSALELAQRTLEGEKCAARMRTSALEAKLARFVPFDECEHKMWNRWNLSSEHGREDESRLDAAQQLQATVAEACKQCCGFLQLWPRAFGGGSDDESASRRQVRTKMSDTVQRLAALVRDTVPGMVGALGPALRRAPPAEGDLRKRSAALTQAHRKWVTYQSLLLLHDWTACAGQPEKEDAHVEDLVACLWRLHRCVRALFSMLHLLGHLPLLATRSSSFAHFSAARDALRGAAVSPAPAGADRPRSVPSRLLERLRGALQDASRCWEELARCLTSLSTAQAAGTDGVTRDSNSLSELLESLNFFGSCMAERVRPAVDRAVACTKGCQRRYPGTQDHALLSELATGTSSASTRGSASPSNSNGYLGRARAHLLQAPASIGFEEALQTQSLARRLSADGSRVKAVTEEKTALANELRALQDRHELLRTNFQVMQGAAARREDEGPHAPRDAATAPRLAPERPAPGAWGDLVLSSRQRALLESLSVTAQESTSLRQHGFFVDVISLSAGEARLAGGPPEAAPEAWEAAVRRVYEQHCRALQAQVRAADGRAVELQLGLQRGADLRREQEDVKQRLRDEVSGKQAQLESLKEDMATTRKNYDSQLGLLTEHICTLSMRLSENDASLASLQAQKILCGHCGTWNPMGKLLSKEGGGTCKTCKEKLLN